MSADATDALSRLRLLVQYEFTTELSNHELQQALRLCNRDVKAAYELLKQKRSALQSPPSAPSTASPAGVASAAATASSASASLTPTSSASAAPPPPAGSSSTTTSTSVSSASSASVSKEKYQQPKRKSADYTFGSSASKRRRDNALALRPLTVSPPSAASQTDYSPSKSTASASTAKSSSASKATSVASAPGYRGPVDPSLSTQLSARFDQVQGHEEDQEEDDEGFELLEDHDTTRDRASNDLWGSQRQQQQQQFKAEELTRQVDLDFHQPRRAPTNNQQNSQDEESMASSQVDSSVARQLLETVLTEMVDDCILSQCDWASQVFDSLDVTNSLECAKQLDHVVEALAQSLRLVTEQDGREWKQSQLDLIISIAAMLPNAQKQDQIVQRLVPTDDDLDERDEAVRNLQSSGVEKTPRRYSRNAIDCITVACSLYIERMKGFATAWERVTQHQKDSMAQFDATQASLTKQLALSQEQVKKCEEKLTEAKATKDENAKKINVFVEQIKVDLLAKGEAEESASFGAYTQILESRDDDVVTLLNARRDITDETETLSANYQRALRKLKYLELLAEFLRVAKEKRLQSLTEAARVFRHRRATSEERVVRQLKEFIPKLMNSLLEFNQFHSLQQEKATEELEVQRLALESHIELFGDAAPSKQEDIEKRIREFMGIITQSTSLMVQIVEAQKTTWLSAAPFLPKDLWRFLSQSFEAMWKKLKGPMKEKFKSVFEEITKTSTEPIEVSAGVTVESSNKPGNASAAKSINAKDTEDTPRNRTKATSSSSGNKSVIYSTVEHQPISMSTSPPMELESSPVRFEIDPKTTRITEVEMQQVHQTPEKFAHPVPSPSQMASPQGEEDVDTEHPKHKFKLADVLYTKFNLGGDRTAFFRGKIVELLDDGRYTMAYDDGDMFTMEERFLFTEEQMEEDLRLQQDQTTPPESPMEQEQQKESSLTQDKKPRHLTARSKSEDNGGTCAIM